MAKHARCLQVSSDAKSKQNASRPNSPRLRATRPGSPEWSAIFAFRVYTQITGDLGMGGGYQGIPKTRQPYWKRIAIHKGFGYVLPQIHALSIIPTRRCIGKITQFHKLCLQTNYSSADGASYTFVGRFTLIEPEISHFSIISELSKEHNSLTRKQIKPEKALRSLENTAKHTG